MMSFTYGILTDVVVGTEAPWGAVSQLSLGFALALPSTEDRASPPLKYQNISIRITQATTSSLKIRRYWIKTPTGLPGESGRPSTSGPTNPP